MGLGPNRVFEDEHCLAVVKPAGQFTQGSWAPPGEQTLEQEVREYLNPADPSAVYLGIVHRLDRPVSGILHLGEDCEIRPAALTQFENRRVEKEYWAIVRGPAGKAHPARGRAGLNQAVRWRRYLDRLADLGRGRGGGAVLLPREASAARAGDHSVLLERRASPARGLPGSGSGPRPAEPTSFGPGRPPRIADPGRYELRGLEAVSAGNCTPCATVALRHPIPGTATRVDRAVTRYLGWPKASCCRIQVSRNPRGIRSNALTIGLPGVVMKLPAEPASIRPHRSRRS